MTGAAAGAGAAGQGGGAAGGGDAGGQAQDGQAEAQGQQQGPDVAALTEQFGFNTEAVDEMRAHIQQLQEGVAEDVGLPSDEGDLDEFDELDAFLDSDEFGDDPAQTAEQLAEIFERGMDERVAQAVEPIRAELAEEKRMREFEHLAAELPELQDKDVAYEVGELAQQWAESVGRPDLAGEPRVWRTMYMAARAAEAANAEGGAEAPQAAHLEGGGGAAPAGGGRGDAFDQVLAAGGAGRQKALPFP